jgi:predicted ATPase
MPLAPGSRLGKYEILSPLGSGGMGEVYRARDSRLGREVALKVLPADVAADRELLARFEREARTVAALNHPNIVTLHSVEDEAGVRFLTMELVEGEGLDQRLASGHLPVERVITLAVAIAEALAAAHEKHIVHRDLKPANVMLAADGRVKVLDFGLARLVAPDYDPASTQAATRTAPLSSAGQVVGTVPYMSPEQVRGEAVDARTDLFAFGITLYEMASGQRPFPGATLGAISGAILHEAPAPLRADIPAGLRRIIGRCLEKEPGARFQTARDLVSELRRVRLTGGEEVATLVKEPPVPATPLLGREENLAAAIARLREGARLLTISGYGGTGKTRLSIELYRRLAGEFPGGAGFISLASVTDPGEVLPAVATALAIPEAHGRSALEALSTVIGQRRVLLVLDNLEQVLEAAGDIAALVARCPELTCIVTSRAPLKVGAEVEYSLPPLDLPAPGATALESVAICPSVALFVQRGAKVKPGFALTSANAGAVAAICRQLDGLPLALELAAARVRILEPAALLQRLDHALDLLTSGDRDLPLRQRTLRATISWSYSLLDPSEQRLLRRLSCFHEGWTLEALERTCYAEEERHRAVDEFDSLVEKGLVRVVGGGERYALLETIRAFAAEQLHASGDVEAARRAHAEYFLAFAGRIAADLRTPAQLDAMARGHGDNANMHAALQWLTAGARAGDAEALERGLLLCGYLDWFWHISAQHLTTRIALDALLPLAADRPSSRGRALALLAAGMVSTTTGEWERSLGEWQGAFDDAKAVGDAEAAAEGVMGVGYCNLSLGRMEGAHAALDEAIARSTGISDFILSLSLSVKGMLLFATRNLDAGMALVTEGRRAAERIADYELRGVAQSFLAQMTFAKGDAPRALVLYEEALETLKTVGDYPEVARVHSEMGWTALVAGDPRAALGWFRRAVHTYEQVGSPRGTGLALLGIAAVEAAEGRSERAVAISAAAQALSERAGIVIEHPMDPGVVERIEALKASIPKGTLSGLVANASTMTPAAVLAMVGEQGDGVAR